MKKVLTSEKIPIKLWCDDVEGNAMRQIKNIANLPFAFHHVAIMPDAHSGYGMPIGGVLATEGMIIPNAVGVDIGCGMCAVQTSLRDIRIENLKKIMGAIRSTIPVGFNRHKTPHKDAMPNCSIIPGGVVEREYTSATRQVGSLGGGNHFIEIQKGSNGYIWLMIHSGSRNIGKQVADFYNRLAKKLNLHEKSPVPPEFDLAYFPIESIKGDVYLAEMNYCLAFAQANRDLMMGFIKDIVGNTMHCEFDEAINIHHNYASLEEHFGCSVILHRKGATAAEEGQFGIIPGSQGTKSYIVKGKGNVESFASCSHGAGRVMGRKQAIRELDLEQETKRLEQKGVLHSIRSRRDLDEAPSAYKDIDVVMENQSDLVNIVVELMPLGVIKG
ncbi:MAG: RtcB family protein [Candidatus Omnitrophica bacterium]|nr:RtcB family protein [Candidatus Omnitrophota bacterium]